MKNVDVSVTSGSSSLTCPQGRKLGFNSLDCSNSYLIAAIFGLLPAFSEVLRFLDRWNPKKSFIESMDTSIFSVDSIYSSRYSFPGAGSHFY